MRQFIKDLLQYTLAVLWLTFIFKWLDDWDRRRITRMRNRIYAEGLKDHAERATGVKHASS